MGKTLLFPTKGTDSVVVSSMEVDKKMENIGTGRRVLHVEFLVALVKKILILSILPIFKLIFYKF